MSGQTVIRCALDDSAGLVREIRRRDRIIDALAYQVERNLNDQDRNYGLLQTTFVLEAQIRQRTAELNAALQTLGEVSARATAAKQQLEAAVEGISDGFALFGPDRCIVLCNEAFRRLSAVSGALDGPLSVFPSHAPDDPDSPPGPERRELQLASGQVLQVRERRMEDGCLVSIYSDVTDLKADEARIRRLALLRKTTLLQATLDTMDEGIAAFDADARLVAWNSRFFALLDVAPELARADTPLAELVALDARIARLAAPATRHDEAFEAQAGDGRALELARFAMPDGGAVLTARDITALKDKEARIRHLLGQQRAILDNAHVGIICARDREILDANARMAEIFGYSSPAELIGNTTEILYPDRQDFLQVGGRVYEELATRGYSEGDVRMVRKDGSALWIRLSGRPLDSQTPQLGTIWVFSDITRQREQHAQLELAQMVFNVSNEALMVSDASNLIISVNGAFTAITGYAEEEVLGRSPSLFKSGHHDDGFYRRMWSELLRADRWEGEIMDRHKSGRIYPKWLSIRLVRNADHGVAYYVAAFSDISARKAAEEKIHYMAHHDALTGLPNRVLLRDRFTQMYRRCQRDRLSLAMFFLDLDHFKRINDTLGHAVGDELLVAVTQRLTTCLRSSDTVSRLGGDEFIVLVEGAGSPRFFATVAEKISQALESPFDLHGLALSTTGTLGIAIAPVDGEDFDTLMKKADMAMYHAKALGRGSYSFFDTRMNRDSPARLALTTSLRHALAQGEMRLVYQPQYAIASGLMIGAEALMRWRSARCGEVSPAQFIPLAEETGLILPLGEWALYQACRQARELEDLGHPLRIAVNVSAVQLYRDDFTTTLDAVLRDTGASPTFIELELTESTLMADAARFIDVIAHLRGRGIDVAIDDFGTGYSSLAYLKRFQVSKLKVDRSFVQDIPADEEDCAIAEAIVRMGQSLKLTVIAEGVETRAQLDFLAAIGCHEAQGYLLSRPVEADALKALLAGGAMPPPPLT